MMHFSKTDLPEPEPPITTTAFAVSLLFKRTLLPNETTALSRPPDRGLSKELWNLDLRSEAALLSAAVSASGAFDTAPVGLTI